MNNAHFLRRLAFGIKMMDWRLLIFCIGFTSVFCFLGVWQLDRAEQKVELLKALEKKRAQTPIEHIDDIKGSNETIDGLPILLRGNYIPGSVVLLDNVVLGGKVGFDELVWFKESGTNRIFLVNRGFVAMARTRTEIPEIPSLDISVDSLLGHIYAREYDEQTLIEPMAIGTINEAAKDKSIRITQQPAPVFLAAGEPAITVDSHVIYPNLIRLAANDPNGLPRNWIVANISPAKHTGYAIQWFLMAAAVVVLFLRVAIKQPNIKTNE